MFEQLIRSRLVEGICAGGDLFPRHLGFRIGRSRVVAVMKVVDRAAAHRCRARLVVLLVTLYVKHVLKSVRWEDILDTLDNTFHLPNYLTDTERLSKKPLAVP